MVTKQTQTVRSPPPACAKVTKALISLTAAAGWAAAGCGLDGEGQRSATCLSLHCMARAADQLASGGLMVVGKDVGEGDSACLCCVQVPFRLVGGLIGGQRL